MKTKLIAVIASGTAVVALCLVGAGFLQTSMAQTESVPPATPDDSTAPVMPVESAALPPNIDTNSALAQVVKLIQSGVSEDVIMAYVTNSTSQFRPNPDQIIYLKDIGAPDELVTAMMQHDQVLQAQTPAASYQPPQPAAPATETVVAGTAYVAAPPTAVTVAEPAAPVTVEYFNDTLAPYGSWVYVSGYGRCWRPTVTVVNAGWQPYADHGHWVWTDCGWYWISDYSWGWAPFHYGRWFCDTRLGWCWYPDTVWGPSWVTWRYSAGYCGWAPLPPHAVYRAGVGFFYNGSAVSVGFNFGLGVSAYTFVPTGNFCDPHPWHYRVPPTHVTQIYNNTTIINNYNEDGHNRRFINHGIDPQHITEVTHAPIRPVAVHETTAHGPRGEQLGRDGHTLYVNRPRFSDNPSPSNRGEPTRSTPVRPVVGSAYPGQAVHGGTPNNNPSAHSYQSAPTTTTTANRGQTPRPTPSRPAGGSANQGSQNGLQNNNPSPARGHQPVAAAPPARNPGNVQRPTPFQPAAGSAYQGQGVQNSSPNNNSSSPRNNQSVTATPRPQRQNPPVASSSPGQPPIYKPFISTDTRRYPSPRVQQSEPQNQRVNPATAAPRAAAPPTPSPAPPQPQPRNDASPRNEPSPGGSHAGTYQGPAAGNQPSSGSFTRSPAPAQSQGSGHGRNQNGQ
jgi:hypothetical protein